MHDIEQKTFQINTETIDLHIQTDLTTGLPLAIEQYKIHQLILTYLALPYSIAEYGCERKANIIFKKLHELGVPAYALQRGMILEPDMSPSALDQDDFSKRAGALTIHNPLHDKVPQNDEVFGDILSHMCDGAQLIADHITTKYYPLSLKERLQFVIARSHIFAIMIMWDSEKNVPVSVVIDPTVLLDLPFGVGHTRELLGSEESLIFTAPLFGTFRLDAKYLTVAQKSHIGNIDLHTIDDQTHRDIILEMTGAQPSTIGDPDAWTYANNVRYNKNTQTYEYQNTITGKGEQMRSALKKLLDTRMQYDESVISQRTQIEKIIDEHNIVGLMIEDANRAEEQLDELADIASSINYANNLRHLSDQCRDISDLYQDIQDDATDEAFDGVATMLRSRIDGLATISADERGSIDAQALNSRYAHACLHMVKQMNRAGLTVAIDSVGNIHGLSLSDVQKKDLKQGATSIGKLTKNAICHCSHIDTVCDAGKYDGRLGVLSGIQIARVLYDLHTFYSIGPSHSDRILMVSAFVGEEMTYTGQNVSMPGSAAVTGMAAPIQVHAMTNARGETYADKLHELLTFLRDQQKIGQIQLYNTFGDDLIGSCCDPTLFYTPNTYERHIEQGPQLDEKNTPLVLVDEIMGIRQLDIQLTGQHAQVGGLQIVGGIRDIVMSDPRYRSTRATVGMFVRDRSSTSPIQTPHAMRWTLQGKMDHAGAARMQDRHNPLVAASRLADFFVEQIHAYNKQNNTRYTPLVGAISVYPGTNRNVIPDSCSLTLAIQELDLPDDLWTQWTNDINKHALISLTKPVDHGGEGIIGCQTQAIDFIDMNTSITLSLDLRDSQSDTMETFLMQLTDATTDVQKKYDTTVSTDLQQSIEPMRLSTSGQVLQLERSYGGSHNPREAMLPRDLMRGTALQFAISYEYLLGTPDLEQNLFQAVHQRIPERWKTKFDTFVSGALHDTCNVAKRTQED